MSLERDKSGWPLPPNGAVAQWTRFIITVLMIPLLLWFLSIEARFLTIDMTRWKLEDHNRFAEAVALDHAQMRLAIESIRAALDTKVNMTNAPPLAYREEVTRRFDEVIDRLARLEARIQ